MAGENVPLTKALANRRSAVVNRWFERLLEIYPSPTNKFLSQERDPFHNPVGHTLRECLSDLFDGLLQSNDIASLAPVLDGIVRIRAVQDFSAGIALAFPFLLKQIIRSEFEADASRYSSELVALEARIDELALLAFELFVQCRERMYELKVNEIRRRSFVLEKARRKEPSSSGSPSGQ